MIKRSRSINVLAKYIHDQAVIAPLHISAVQLEIPMNGHYSITGIQSTSSLNDKITYFSAGSSRNESHRMRIIYPDMFCCRGHTTTVPGRRIRPVSRGHTFNNDIFVHSNLCRGSCRASGLQCDHTHITCSIAAPINCNTVGCAA